MDGLEFRYRWATEGLTDQDLAFRIRDSARSTSETLEHIYNIVEMTEYAFSGETYLLPEQDVDLSVSDLRRLTLDRVSRISGLLSGQNGEDLEALQARFQLGDEEHTFPFWNTVNGTMSDAMYHVGQVVSFRRASGNPIDPTAQVYLGAKPEAEFS